jgi:hypothetical protein
MPPPAPVIGRDCIALGEDTGVTKVEPVSRRRS